MKVALYRYLEQSGIELSALSVVAHVLRPIQSE